MVGVVGFLIAILLLPFKSKARLQAENAALRHQVIILHRKSRGRVCLSNADRWFFVQLYRLFPSIAQALHILRPETLVRWHRAGFRGYWRWKSRKRGGRPQTIRPLSARRSYCLPTPRLMLTASRGNQACTPNVLPVRCWQAKQ
jgi:hypothetical protein